MKAALKSVTDDGISISKAARTYNIPESTLFDHKTGNVATGKGSGRPTILTEEKEKDLCSFLIESSQNGYLR